MKLYQVDAFSNKVFGGNPAAIVLWDQWPADELMQKIAMENNLAETGYLVPKGSDFEIRWFTPVVEVDLCGHATLAAAHVLFEHLNYQGNMVNLFSPRSGLLKVERNGKTLTLDFPADSITEIEVQSSHTSCFSKAPEKVLKGKTDLMFVFRNEEEIISLIPDLTAIQKLPVRGIIATAKGTSSDFVSRFFAPQSGVNEDPVTGSAHTTLTPYWSRQLGKEELTAVQLSSRKGYLTCRLSGSRVLISGEARTYMVGDFAIE
ncbi:MAG: PhzF family phenazine biosynthesis protein [Bacteroidetes bacterium]|nr:PhzF family phenazine biosynthesis protein [Bacteroidota bacterium]